MKRTFTILVLTISTLASINALKAQWIQQNSGTTEKLIDVVMLDSSTAIVVGENQNIFKTTNSGVTWNFLGLTWSFPMNWKNISFCDKQYGVLVGGNNIITTTDGGDHWSLSYQSYEKNFLSALCLHPGNIYAGDDSGYVYHSIDSGKTWSSEKISTLPIRSIFAYRGPTILGLPLYALTSHSIITKNEFFPITPRDEKELKFFNGLGSEAYRGEFCNGGRAGFIVGVQGDLRSAPAIIRKSMSDTAWLEVSTAILQDGILFGVSAPSANVIYVCGSNGMIFNSSDGGDTWIAHTVPTMRNMNAIYLYDEKRGFSVGDSGLILYTSNGGVTSVHDPDSHLQMKFALDQNYPNPFNLSTMIIFHLPFTSFVSLKIFDILGRDVATLAFEELTVGIHFRQWNAAGMPSGVYFYRLQVRSFSETKKLVLLR
ncbi:MAG: T9SS type A sorting domain-containing protein [Bacteroidetes bacterium]|nr:T9SS type A sorting domain-containing protein [Bacteroidota bacterium]